MSPPWRLLLFPAISTPFALASLAACLRRRWRTGLRWMVCSVAVLALSVAWAGHEFLSRDWSEPFLCW